jgi:hypothetical protein
LAHFFLAQANSQESGRGRDHEHYLDSAGAIQGDVEVFVIQRLSDETIPESVLSAVRQHAEHECPLGSERLCKELATAAK